MKNIKKMKKVSIKLIAIPLLMSLCSFKVNNDYDKELVNNIFTSLTYMDEGFKGSSISSPIKLIDNNDQSCLLFKTYLNNKYTGYFILDNNYELLISHVDSLDYYQDVEDYYYLTDIFTISKDRKEITSKSNVKSMNKSEFLNNQLEFSNYSSTYYNLPFINDSVLVTYSSSFGSSMRIQGVPTYYNSPDEFSVFPGGGCSPTAAAMFLSFYDRNSPYFYNVFDPDLPLKQEDDNERVKSIIKDLGNLMGTDSSGNTYDIFLATGTANYLALKGLDNYTVTFYNATLGDFKDIDYLKGYLSGLISRKNIAMLYIDTEYKPGNEKVETNHTVVLTGYDNYQYVGPSVRVNYGWQSYASDYSINIKSIGTISCFLGRS